MIRWIDVSPYDWFYRDVLDSSRLVLDPVTGNTLFESIAYNKFKTGRERLVKSYISVDNQVEFALPGYIPSDDNPVLAYVGGTPTPVETAPDKVFMPNPLTAGLEVVLMAAGEPELIVQGCHEVPALIAEGEYPGAHLSHEADYVFNINYTYNETATAMGRKLKRIELNRFPGETIQDAMRRVVGWKRNVFTIEEGRICTSFELWNIPITVEYNYKDADGTIRHRVETVIPTCDVVAWNDRFFPDVTLLRSEFFVLLQRMRKNLYNRFTDRPYVPVLNNERNIPDIPLDQWYSEDVFDIINERFLDGCYVFPLYEDNTFNPDGCITRAEAATYLHRFIEWALERFR